MDVVLDYAITQNTGIFSVLFIALLGVSILFVKWVLKTNNDREERYVKVIEEQAKGLQSVEYVKRDVSEIKTLLMKGREVG